jgi:hypothetical protein
MGHPYPTLDKKNIYTYLKICEFNSTLKTSYIHIVQKKYVYYPNNKTRAKNRGEEVILGNNFKAPFCNPIEGTIICVRAVFYI